jgi:ATP-binding cassette subfamily B protein IrtB
MALAALWVVPVSAAIVMGSYRVQDKVQAKTMAARMAASFPAASVSAFPLPAPS